MFCFTILLGIIGCQTGVFRDSHDSADIIRVAFWVQSFSPVSFSFQQKCSEHRWQRHPRCHTSQHGQTYSKPLSVPLPLYAIGENDSNNDENTGGATTTMVISVFSKPPKKVFRQLLEASATSSKGEAGLLRMKDIYASTDDNDGGCWNELNEIIDDGDLSVQELQGLYDAAAVDGGEGLDMEGFKRLYQSIDDLFDDDDDDVDDDEDDVKNSDRDESKEDEEAKSNPNNTEIESSNSNTKQDLVSFLEEVQNRNCDSEDRPIDDGKRRPWGLDCSDKERKVVLELIEGLLAETSNSNVLTNSNNRGLPMSAKDLTKYVLGTWDLKYTSSRSMIINKSLSGLGRSTSKLARNLGLQMTLTGSYYAGRAEFVETFGSAGGDTNDDDEENDSDSDMDTVLLQATVTGEWILESGTRMDYKTGLPSVSLRVEVETIAYGPTKSDAEQWDSLSPIKLLDVLYLDENLLVLRGNANLDAMFVYTRR